MCIRSVLGCIKADFSATTDSFSKTFFEIYKIDTHLHRSEVNINFQGPNAFLNFRKMFFLIFANFSDYMDTLHVFLQTIEEFYRTCGKSHIITGRLCILKTSPESLKKLKIIMLKK